MRRLDTDWTIQSLHIEDARDDQKSNRASRRKGRDSLLFAQSLLIALLLWPASPALAQVTQYGGKLVGSTTTATAAQGVVAVSRDGLTAIVGGPNDSSPAGGAWVFTRGAGWSQPSPRLSASNTNAFGYAVALSADGNTALIGSDGDNNQTGAAWVFTRSNGTWQQGIKLVGSDVIGDALQGSSVAVSADGTTAAVGGSFDSGGAGAVWIFVHGSFGWLQDGSKLVGTGAIGLAGQGSSVALSADGNTLLVGGNTDNGSTGATWVFTRSNSGWTQQAKLVGTGMIGSTGNQGVSVALSGDGNIALVGGSGDNGGVGAAWVFKNGGFGWVQQGSKLVGSGSVGTSHQGISVALSGDGNVALVGGSGDSSNIGAAWTFTLGPSGWSQLGSKLIGTNTVGAALVGRSVALSGDGTTAFVGGPGDNNILGATWVFVAPSAERVASHNFNGDAFSDIAWRRNDGTVAAWLTSFVFGVGFGVQAGSYGVVPANWQLVGQRDFNGDLSYDWLWRDGSSGTLAVWLLNGLQVTGTRSLGAVAGNWAVVGTSDFNLDGTGDILWRDTSSGAVAIWLLTNVGGLHVSQNGSLGVVPANWQVAATDGSGNIVWRDSNTGAVVIWRVYGVEVTQTVGLGAVPMNWVIAGVGDFDGNGSTDILWRDTATGSVAIWLMDGLSLLQTGGLGVVAGNWQIAATGDFHGLGKSDILWYDTNSGTAAVWQIKNLQVSSTASVGTAGTDWTIQGLNAE